MNSSVRLSSEAPDEISINTERHFHWIDTYKIIGDSFIVVFLEVHQLRREDAFSRCFYFVIIEPDFG